MNNYFIVQFTDKTTFKGDQFKGEWKNIPDKEIEKVEYCINNKKYFIQGYKEYNHQFDKHTKFGTGTTIVAAIWMLREENRSLHIRFDFEKKKILKTYTKLEEECVRPIWEGIYFVIPEAIIKANNGTLTNKDIGIYYDFKGWTEGTRVTGWSKGYYNKPGILKID